MIYERTIAKTFSINVGKFRIILKQMIILARKCDICSNLNPRGVITSVVNYLGNRIV